MEEKPPIGIEPRWIHNMIRSQEIVQAMSSYIASRMAIPQEWLDELSELNEINKSSQKSGE